MTELDDHKLLAEFARSASESAFDALVARHVNLVYSTALRFTGNPHHAQEITQAVFVILARKAGSLRRGTVLSGWLYQTARLTAANFVKGETRRQRREQEAYMLSTLNESGPAAWQQIAALLDDAMGDLGETDRNAVVLRFFENKTAQEVGAALNLTEAAAHKRVSRALEKLRLYLSKRGIALPAAALTAAISANAVQAAPVGLAVTISTAAALTGTTLATATTATAIKTITMTTIQKVVITATLAVVAGAGIFEARQASQLREQVHTLRQQQETLTEQIRNLEKSYDDATNQLALLHDDNERFNRNTMELLRLRGEVSRLRSTPGELERARYGIDIKTNEGFGGTADALAKRANSFKQWFEQNPDKSIPELQLLTDADWLFEASLNLKVVTNRSEGNDIHMVADSLRQKAKQKFANLLGHALGNYIASNEGSLPSELSQLLVYFSPPGDTSPFARSIDPSILQRYDLLHTGKIKDVPQGDAIIREKAPVDDDIDGVLSVAVGSHSMQSTGKIIDEMRQGQPSGWLDEDIKKIQPFLK